MPAVHGTPCCQSPMPTVHGGPCCHSPMPTVHSGPCCRSPRARIPSGAVPARTGPGQPRLPLSRALSALTHTATGRRCLLAEGAAPAQLRNTPCAEEPSWKCRCSPIHCVRTKGCRRSSPSKGLTPVCAALKRQHELLCPRKSFHSRRVWLQTWKHQTQTELAEVPAERAPAAHNFSCTQSQQHTLHLRFPSQLCVSSQSFSPTERI